VQQQGVDAEVGTLATWLRRRPLRRVRRVEIFPAFLALVALLVPADAR
jgi:hypothetical protein